MSQYEVTLKSPHPIDNASSQDDSYYYEAIEARDKSSYLKEKNIDFTQLLIYNFILYK